MHTYTTQQQIREAFWEAFPELESEAREKGTFSKGHNDQTTNCRCTFSDFLDFLYQSHQISERLAQDTTL